MMTTEIDVAGIRMPLEMLEAHSSDFSLTMFFLPVIDAMLQAPKSLSTKRLLAENDNDNFRNVLAEVSALIETHRMKLEAERGAREIH